jgi:hypothetical protein
MVSLLLVGTVDFLFPFPRVGGDGRHRSRLPVPFAAGVPLKPAEIAEPDL